GPARGVSTDRGTGRGPGQHQEGRGRPAAGGAVSGSAGRRRGGGGGDRVSGAAKGGGAMKTLGVLLSLSLVVGSAAPPEKGRELTAEEMKEVARLDQAFNDKVDAGEFEEAVKTAKQIVDYRAERQGDSHWEVSNARWNMKLWQRPAKDCAEVK